MTNWIKQYSVIALLLCYIILFLGSFIYYPKYHRSGSEATISWDVSGYYSYLPAVFIYGDLTQLNFLDSIVSKYHPTPDVQQAFWYNENVRVFKYSCGQALVFSPFFLVAHVYAINSNYPADGFSTPYQFMISVGMLLVAFLGLWFLRKVLLRFFSDKVTAISLILLVFGTNYLEYASISFALTHNTLFTVYSLLIFMIIRFYDKQTFVRAAIVGAIVGLTILIRPTEMLSLLLPMLWGISAPFWKGFKERLAFFIVNYRYTLTMIFSCLLMGSIQLIYWKSVSGDWIVYSYGKQGFSFLAPHIYNATLSFRGGWLIYTPVMFFSLLGFVPLYRSNKNIFLATLVFSLLFIYVAFSWDIWWYGASVGQRSMVQAYAVLCLPLAAFVDLVFNLQRIYKYVFIPLALLFIYLNILLVHNAHYGGNYSAGSMTSAYYWRTFGKWTQDRNDKKLLDTNEDYRGKRNNIQQIFMINLDSIDNGTKHNGILLRYKKQTDKFFFSPPSNAAWLRAYAKIKLKGKEWNKWNMRKMEINFLGGDRVRKTRFIRIDRQFDNFEELEIYMDIKIPDKYDRVNIQFTNPGSKKELVIRRIWIESFNE
ncbi:MAG: hypothetical protein IH946_04145 [Bacteroidetes bacterium]|nr:hypothetical protein [Bacteroidota bacterium]